MANKALNFLSLFSGCGGFDLGFQKEGFRCVGAYDIDPVALKTHQKNLESPVFQCDLTLSTGSLFRQKKLMFYCPAPLAKVFQPWGKGI
ncbi:DNA cytosine methyltransferase [Nitrospina gracilis]|uniref:DNA cytosine methyltransferase n=1 Tax=Nitrospina gracilis TaxID=35801 RepID=UPI0005AB4D4E